MRIHVFISADPRPLSRPAGNLLHRGAGARAAMNVRLRGGRRRLDAPLWETT